MGSPGRSALPSRGSSSTFGLKARARSWIYSTVGATRVIEGGILFGSQDPGESGRPA